MKKSRFSETQIVSIRRQYDGGTAAADLCREHSISTGTLYRWKAKYGGLEASHFKRIRELEEENGKVKRMYTDVGIQRDALKDLMGKSSNA